MTTPLRVHRRTAAVPFDFPAALHPVVQRVLAARGVRSAAEFDTSLDGLLRPDGLAQVDRAVALLAEALEARSRICIVADYDADGATSCALGLRALRAFGAHHVDFLVPNRFEYGYGLTPPIVDLALARGAELLVTVDNGISSCDGVAAAKAAGLRVLVTDHHLPGPELPAADAIVNPNVEGDRFPSKALAGVGVIFYVLVALRAHLRARGWFVDQGLREPNLAAWLDLVALGTVADVATLDANNRRLVAQGLERLRSGRGTPGIVALCRVSGREPARMLASDFGFRLGPRLNAAGRLADMALGIELLASDDPTACERMARELDAMNLERREIEADMKAQALAILERLPRDEASALPAGLCLFDAAWHQGVTGIVASRVKDLHHRPTVVFARAGGTELKGSARSVPGVHVRDVLERVATRHPGLITRFGGHAMAAGLALEASAFEPFAAAFAEEIECVAAPELLERVLLTDGELAPADFSLALARALRDAGPWGQGFPEPLFEGSFRIAARRVVGEHHVKLMLDDGGRIGLDAIAFNAAQEPWARESQQIRAVFRLDINEWQGTESLQLVIEHAHAC